MLTFVGCSLGCCARLVAGGRMPDLHADWELVGWEYALDEDGTKEVAWVEGYLVACVGKEEVDDYGKGWVMRETCLQVDVMEKVEVTGEDWAPVIIMREFYRKNLPP